MKLDTFLKRFIALLIFGGIYYISGKFGLSLAIVHPSATPIWPPTGIAIATFLLLGYWATPIIFLGAFFINFTTAGTVLTSLSIATGNTLEGLFAAYLINKLSGGVRTFYRATDIFIFVVMAGILATSISATFGATTLVLSKLADIADYGSIWITWWLGDMAGALILTPFIVLWAIKSPYAWTKKKTFEAICMYAAFGTTSAVVLYQFHFVFLFLPVLIWAAFRFGEREAATMMMLVASFFIWSALHGIGPFTSGGLSLNETLLFLQTFLSTSSITLLALAALASEMTQKEERFKALIEEGSDAISLIDSSSRIIYSSASATHVIGYSPQELVGTNGLSLVHPEDIERTKKFVEDIAREPGSVRRIEVRAKRKDGSLIWVENTLTNLLENPAVRAIVVNFRDITERREIDHSKSEFISIASHELRTPLSIIQWHLESLRRRWAEHSLSKKKEYVNIIQQANDRMITLVNDLLSVSRVELAAFKIEPEPTDLYKLTKRVVQESMHEIKEKSIRCAVHLDPHLLPVSVDPKLMREILSNLLSNAIHYTPEKGKVDITFDRNAAEFSLTISDTGSGIPEKDMSKIFTKFFRASNARNAHPDGTGLGLYITKSIVELCGGRIWFESHKHHGTAFHIAFPILGMKAKSETSEEEPGV